MEKSARGNRVEAEVTIEETVEVKERALAPIYQSIRHPLCSETKETDFDKAVREELALDEVLGFKEIAEETARKTLSRDIDELTDSKDYVEVTRRELEKLFHIKQLNLVHCAPHNLAQKLGVFLKITLGTTTSKINAAIAAITVPLGIYFYLSGTWTVVNRMDIFPIIGMVACYITVVVSIFNWAKDVFNISYEQPRPGTSRQAMPSDPRDDADWHDMSNQGQRESLTRYLQKRKQTDRIITYTKISVFLKIVPLDELDMAEIKIPRGAKLKAAEAVKSEIFTHLVVAYPKFEAENHLIEVKERIIPRLELDPAICGVTADGRFFMVVCWDILKDIDKTIKSIKAFKHLKLKQTV